MKTREEIAALVERMPDADRPGAASKFTGPKPEVAEEVFEEILKGGREAVDELIGLVRAPGEEGFKNYKAEYVLHGLALHVGGPGKERQRRMLARLLASKLGGGGASKLVQAMFVRELQVVGGREVVKVLGNQLSDPDLCEYAAQALIAIGEDAAAVLRKALPGAGGKNRVTIAQALGVLRDAGAVGALKDALGETDRDVRMAATWALGNIGDAGAAGAVIGAADRSEGWERIQATKACLLLAERLLESGKKRDAVRIYTHLRDTRADDADEYVRDAAKKALAAAGG